MTAEGELYITEECRDVFTKELNTKLGKNKWRLDGSKFSSEYTMNNFPKVVEVPIRDYSFEKVIGTATIFSKPVIVDREYSPYDERFITMEPVKIKIIKGDKK